MTVLVPVTDFIYDTDYFWPLVQVVVSMVGFHNGTMGGLISYLP